MSDRVLPAALANQLIIEWITKPDQWEKLFAFAKSCEHEVYFNPNIHKIFVVKKRGTDEWVGWCRVSVAPLLEMSWHKDQCTPRQVLEGAKMIGGWSRIQFGEAQIAVPIDSETFTPEVMEKLGCYPTGTQVYVSGGLI